MSLGEKRMDEVNTGCISTEHHVIGATSLGCNSMKMQSGEQEQGRRPQSDKHAMQLLRRRHSDESIR